MKEKEREEQNGKTRENIRHLISYIREELPLCTVMGGGEGVRGRVTSVAGIEDAPRRENIYPGFKVMDR